jgi:hypothetical protein
MEIATPGWIKGLSEEDWQFIKRLLLASGSLKDVAEQYGISYPTVRLRLDRLIEKVKILDSQKPKTKFEQTVQLLAAEGRLDFDTARTILKMYREDTKKVGTAPSTTEREDYGNLV